MDLPPPQPMFMEQPSPLPITWASWSINRVVGLSLLASFMQNDYLFNSAKLLVLGTLIEAGRRLCYWLFDRFKFEYCVTARFDQGDPAYDWILLFLTKKKIWHRTRDFIVNARNSKRKWGINDGPGFKLNGNAEYVPTYELPQLFRWRGYWVEVKRNKFNDFGPSGPRNSAVIYISVYTLDMGAISELVEEARDLYKETSKPNVVVYSADVPSYGPEFVWSNVKNKARRPLSSVILLDGVINSLVKDVEEFIQSEDWYIDAGIPYRRGYLLYGPPGTGKTSTIYALAGTLGLEIYSLSLSSHFVDDSFLQKAASSIPKHSIFLIEDIDCAFPPREELEQPHTYSAYRVPGERRSMVTLSGLLNVLDGVGSEEGKLFFATTNHIENLDAALLRPGRVDKRMQYFQATPAQADALFKRFYSKLFISRSPVCPTDEKATTDAKTTSTDSQLSDLEMMSSQFASRIPKHTFSTAELQGYLLTFKKDPQGAVDGAQAWVEAELEERGQRAKEERERVRRLWMPLVGSPVIPPADPAAAGVANSAAVPPLPTSLPTYPYYGDGVPAMPAATLPVVPDHVPATQVIGSTPPDSLECT